MWRLRNTAKDDAVEPSVRSGAAMSAIVHLGLIAACVLYAHARPFAPKGDQTIAVDIVAPQDVEALPPPAPNKDAPETRPAEQTPQPPPPAAQPPAVPKQASGPPPAAQKPMKQRPTALQQQATTPPPQQQATSQAAQPAYRAPEPDITVKYQVDLGLMGLAPSKGSDEFDVQAASSAKVARQDVAAFRAKLKACGTLPAQVSPDDKVVIKLRAMFTPDGHLARAPVLIEASASAKGPLLMQAAVAALEACQPYAMLPADKYDEWKILDLPFTPQDFGRG